MEIFTLLKREIKTPQFSLIVFVTLSSFSSVLLIAVINSSAESLSHNALGWKNILLYALCLGLLFFSKRFVLDRTSEMVLVIITRIRYNLADKVRLTELATLEKYGTSTIYARITQDAATISNVASILINAGQQGLMIFFTLFYIALISFQSFLIVAIGLAASLLYYVNLSDIFNAMWRKVSEKETEFFDALGHILQGFNEININRRKNEDVFKEYVEVNNSIKRERTKINTHYNVFLVFSEISFFLLIGVILFILPKLHTENPFVIIKVITSVLFTVGPLEAVIYALPGFANANNAARNIMELEGQLEEDLKKMREQNIDNYSPAAYQVMPFKSQIELENLTYHYPNNNGHGQGFQVGPIDLTIHQGELVFITGGNGSGKSTFLKLFTGLYKPSRGQIKIDSEDDQKGTVVTMRNYQQYQNLLSIIFTDYHLLKRIYGIEQAIDPNEVKALLKRMELPEDRTTYENGAFTNISLSSGQKKRLVLITSLLEDKSIYLFDEVAADLDPEFRDKFYFEILQELKARHKTILVVSHDQQYWHVADRLLQFKDGRMRELSTEEMNALTSIALKQS